MTITIINGIMAVVTSGGGGGASTSITGLVSAGTNITITGNGTVPNPFIINSTGGSGNLGTNTSAANPAISGDLTTGFYTAGAGLVDVTINGTKTVEWNSTSENLSSGISFKIAGGNALSFPTSDNTPGASIAIGISALSNQPASAAYSSIGIGYQALSGTMTTAAVRNVAIGSQALKSVTSGTQNVAVGIGAGNGITTNNDNILIGTSAGSQLNSGTNGFNVIIGSNTAIVSNGTSRAFILGQGAKGGSDDIAIGNNANRFAASDSAQNVAIGSMALGGGNPSGEGLHNTAVGYQSGSKLNSGTAANNLFLGYNVGSATLTTGSNNILIGGHSGIDVPATGTNNFLNLGNAIFATGMATSGTTPTGSVGILTTAPTVTLDINGAGRFRSSSTPTLTDGEIWNDSTQIALITNILGNKLYNRSALFMQTATKTVVNSGAETSILGTGVGSKTIAVNTLTAGKTITILGGGVYSTTTVPGNITIKIKIGSVVVATGTITNLISLASNNAFQFNAMITVRSTGGSGTVMCNGNVNYETAALTRGFVALNNGGSTSTIDTTASQAIDVTLTWATADAANSLSTIVGTIELTA